MSRLVQSFGLALCCAILLHVVLCAVEAWTIVQVTTTTPGTFTQLFVSHVTSGDRMSTAAIYVAILVAISLLWTGSAKWCVFAWSFAVTAVTMWVVSARTFVPAELAELRTITGSMRPLHNYGISLVNGDSSAYLASAFVFILSAAYFSVMRMINLRTPHMAPQNRAVPSAQPAITAPEPPR